MIVKLTNLDTQLVSASDAEREWLDEQLVFEDTRDTFVRVNGKVKRTAPRKVRLFDGVRFPAGLTAQLRRTAAAAGFTFDVLDGRERPEGTPRTIDEVPADEYAWLASRDYQVEALRRSIQRTRGILWLPTGSGKTEIAVALANTVKCRWLFLVNEADLLHNAARRFEKRTNESAGRLGDGQHSIERFTVATFQTIAHALRRPAKNASAQSLAKRDAILNLLAGVEGIIIDEVHTLPADSFYRVALSCVRAFYRIGMSGTPLARGDKRSMFSKAATGDVIYRVKPEVLMESGHISRPTIYMVPIVQAGTSTEYAAAYSKLVARSKLRNDAVVEMTKRVAKPALVFVQHIAHGQSLARSLKAAGMNVEFVWGSKSTSQRDDAIRRLRWGDLDAIVCSTVFQTGTDIPEIAGLVIASAGKSDIATIQRIGRGTRVTATKRSFEVYDVLDRDGLAEDGTKTAAKWLASHANKRRAAYLKEGYEVRVLDVLGAQLSLDVRRS